MQLKHFVLSVKNLRDSEAEMNGFLRSHRVLAVKKEFVPDGENSFWTYCVEYLDSAGAFGSAAGGRPPKVDYKEILKPEEFEVFSRLREWRRNVAEKEGVPVYTVLTNDQLAQIVEKKINSKASLREIDGVGDVRIEKYGNALLELLVSSDLPKDLLPK